MTKRILITGKLGLKADAKALVWLVAYISDTKPDELVCFESSVPMLDQLREVYAGPIGIHAGEFDSRHEITELSDVYRVAPGWVTTSRVDGYEPSDIAGNTALRAAKAYNTSVVLGHTSRMGVGSQTYTHEGKAVRSFTGMEVGTLTDKRLARGIKGHRGFGLLTIGSQHVTPEAVSYQGTVKG